MDLSNYKEVKPHRMKRLFWLFVNHTIFRLCFGRVFWPIRRFLLISFGAKVDHKAYIYSQCDIFAPWNLQVGRACVGPGTVLYNKDMLIIGNDSVISQGCNICTASHDIESLMLPLKTRPIIIKDHVWVASDAFVGMGVTIGEGAVVGARGCVFKDVEPWTVVGGNPAKFIKERKIANRDA